MTVEKKEFRKVSDITQDMVKNIAEIKRVGKPYFDKDGTFIERENVFTLDDGTEVEFCLWSWEDVSAWDVSVDKEAFDRSGHDDFVKYLSEKGLYAGNIEDDFGDRWVFAGQIECGDVYRVQYVKY